MRVPAFLSGFGFNINRDIERQHHRVFDTVDDFVQCCIRFIILVRGVADLGTEQRHRFRKLTRI